MANTAFGVLAPAAGNWNSTAVSEEFARQQNHCFIGSKALERDAAAGRIPWKARWMEWSGRPEA